MTPDQPTALVEVTQGDREAAASITYSLADERLILAGKADLSLPVQAFARHRIAALEAAARYVEGHGGAIPGAAVFAPLVSGNNMPCMSGDPRDRLFPHLRRRFDDATRALAAAIRKAKEGSRG